MPITDNNFTAQDLTAALTANPDLANEVRTSLSGLNYSVRDESEDREYRTNVETAAKSNLTREHASSLEKDVEEATGIKKLNDNEKYYDYFKRAIGEKMKSIPAMEKELAELKKNTNPSETAMKRMEALEKTIADNESGYKTREEQLLQENKELRLSNSIDAGFAAHRPKYRKDYPADLVSNYEASVKRELMGMAKIENGETVYYENGSPLLDSKTAKPMTAQQIIGEKVKSLLDTSATQTGTGSTAQSQADQGVTTTNGVVDDITSIPASVKTKEQLTEYMLKQGWTQKHPKFVEVYDKFGKNLPLR